MEASTLFDVESKLISLDDKKCTVGRDKKQVTCTQVNSCLKYNGINLPATAGMFLYIFLFFSFSFLSILI